MTRPGEIIQEMYASTNKSQCLALRVLSSRYRGPKAPALVRRLSTVFGLVGRHVNIGDARQEVDDLELLLHWLPRGIQTHWE
jgi:hypothetical protein